MGIYKVPAGGVDHQQPHTEDEVCFVLEGRGCFKVGKEVAAVEAGHLLIVPEWIPHCFHDITEDLRALVFFAPAESRKSVVATT